MGVQIPKRVVAQQALALVLEHGQIGRPDLLVRLGSAFPEQAEVDIAALLDHLVALQFLVDAGALVLIVGPATERAFGRGHYRELLASFSGHPLLTGRHGTSEIGLIDPSSLLNRDERPIVLLAGRSWLVREIDWRRRVAWLEPSTMPGRSRWQGGTRNVSAAVAGAIRRVLQADLAPEWLSRRGRSAWEDLRSTMPVGDGTTPVSARDGAFEQRWTYAGTRANRTLARAMQGRAHAMRFDALKVEWQGAVDTAEIADVPLTDVTADEREAFADAVKFHQLLPRSLLDRQLAARLWVLGQPAVQ